MSCWFQEARRPGVLAKHTHLEGGCLGSMVKFKGSYLEQGFPTLAGLTRTVSCFKT